MSHMATMNETTHSPKPEKKQNRQAAAPKSSGPMEYLQGVKSEWGKITWPTWPQIVGQTIVVLVMVSIMTAGLFFMDNLFHTLVTLITPHRS